MIEIILEEKQDLDFEKLKTMIEEKKTNVGAGYLTDQGALFLVAADLGISLEKTPKSEYSLKDVFVGARDVTTVGRIMTINPIKIFLKRDSNLESRNRIIHIYDKDSNVKIKLWDDFVDLPEQLDLKLGDLIKVSKGQVKAGMDNKPIINLSSNGSIEIVSENGKYQIPLLSELTETIDDLDVPKENMVISGRITSDPRISAFTNSRGERAKSLHMELSNDSNTRKIRSIIWNINDEKVPKSLTTGSKIKLIGVKTKIGNPNFSNGDLEIHGDEGTGFELVEQIEPVESYTLRIVSARLDPTERKTHCMAIDKDGKSYLLSIDNKLFDIHFETDDIIECYPSRVLGNTIEITGQESYIQILKEDNDIPKSDQFESKIMEVDSMNKPYVVEVIVLQNPNKVDVNTKSGEIVSVADTIVGDDTGEIRLVGWRESSGLVIDLKIGERVRILGVNAASGKEGNIELSLKPYSNIVKIS
jgi:ssDNA-binding replication factor A large subunit